MNYVITIVYIIQILYNQQLIKAYQDFQFYDYCMTFILHFTPFMMKLSVQHMGDTFLTLTKFQLSYQTYHFEFFPFSMIERSGSILFTTGKFTRVDYLRIKELDLP